jgi:hypothetical protein
MTNTDEALENSKIELLKLCEDFAFQFSSSELIYDITSLLNNYISDPALYPETVIKITGRMTNLMAFLADLEWQARRVYKLDKQG